jgi:Fic family protein
LPNNVVAKSPAGEIIGTIFSTATPFDTPRLMTELLDWTNRSLELKIYHPLLVIGIFIVHFLAIHPFQDGNGRLSRILSNLLLLKSGYTYIPYASLESIVESNKNNYYLALRTSQSTFEKDHYDAEPWVNFFLNTLSTHKNILEKVLTNEKSILKLPVLSSSILDLAKTRRKITTPEVALALGKSKRTINTNIKKLLDFGYLEAHGAGKARFYTLSELI